MKRRSLEPVVVDPWRGFADLMLTVGLVLIFLVMTQFLANSRALSRMVLEDRQRKTEQLLRSSLGSHDEYAQFVTDGNLQRVRFSSKILFDAGKSELKDLGRRLLSEVGPVLARPGTGIVEIQIEGHTDDTPIRLSDYASNWALSSARAASVVAFLQERAGLNPRTQPVSATGRAEFAPVGGDFTNRDRNRRIELVLVYSEKGLSAR
jgi:flagellar motor protein MotB